METPLGEDAIRPATRTPGARRMLSRARDVIRLEARALNRLAQRLDGRICAVADLILGSEGLVVVTGVGKSRLVGEKISATLASTGTRSISLDPTDALHGDLGRLRREDLLLCISNSGETEELKRLVTPVRTFGVKIVAITGNAGSSLAQLSDFVLDTGAMAEACPLGLAPTTTSTAQMALGDALAMILLERRGFTRADFARFHPAGRLAQLAVTAATSEHPTGDDDTSSPAAGAGVLTESRGCPRS